MLSHTHMHMQQVESLYRAQLEQLLSMGFSDRQANIRGAHIPLRHFRKQMRNTLAFDWKLVILVGRLSTNILTGFCPVSCCYHKLCHQLSIVSHTHTHTHTHTHSLDRNGWRPQCSCEPPSPIAVRRSL